MCIGRICKEMICRVHDMYVSGNLLVYDYSSGLRKVKIKSSATEIGNKCYSVYGPIYSKSMTVGNGIAFLAFCISSSVTNIPRKRSLDGRHDER